MLEKAIDEQIWEVFNLLRGKLDSEEYYVVLFLLSLYKDDVLSKDILVNNVNFNQSLTAIIRESDSSNANNYLRIFHNFEPTLKRLSSNNLNGLLQAIFDLDKKTLLENFAIIFDNVLYKLTESQGKFGGEFMQPAELTRFICTLADLPKKSTVFNPFAGLASFGVCFDKNQDYFGQEINQSTWALGTLRIMAYERSDTYRYVSEDSILHWPKSDTFDLVVANPPYGMRLGQRYQEVEPTMSTIEQFLIEWGVASLNPSGKLIVILPQGVLFRGSHEQRLRGRLIEEDLIDTVISIPGGVLSNTGIPLAILVISKTKEVPGKVRLITAEKFIKLKASGQKALDDYGLNKVIQQGYQNSDDVRMVEIGHIRENDYNLNLPRYFQEQIKGVKLKDFVELIKGYRKDIPESGKMIRIRDLKDDKLDFKLDLSNIEETELRRRNLRLIGESCILVSTRWKTLRPTLFEFAGTPIFLNPDILCFKIDSNVVDTDFLINELHADYVISQVESYNQGATIPMIRRDDLLEIVIKLTSLEEQKAKVQGIKELSNTIRVLQRDRNALVHGTANTQFNEFASLKHTLGRPRQNILDWADNLLHFLSNERQRFDQLNKSFEEFYETDIISALNEIKRDVNFMTDVLEKGENGFLVEEYDKTVIALTDVNSIISDLSSNGFNFKIKKLLLKSEKLKERGIYGNKVLLKTLIDNLLTNAHKYGFEEKTSGNEVVFELDEVNDFLLLEVRNNGKPFPKNYDREKFIVKYSTANSKSGTGLGGYDIHRIASEFQNPNWTLTLNEDPIYPVIFEFQFPIKLIN